MTFTDLPVDCMTAIASFVSGPNVIVAVGSSKDARAALRRGVDIAERARFGLTVREAEELLRGSARGSARGSPRGLPSGPARGRLRGFVPSVLRVTAGTDRSQVIATSVVVRDGVHRRRLRILLFIRP